MKIPIDSLGNFSINLGRDFWAISSISAQNVSKTSSSILVDNGSISFNNILVKEIQIFDINGRQLFGQKGDRLKSVLVPNLSRGERVITITSIDGK